MDFVKIEDAGKKLLEQFPFVKRSAKRLYQLLSYATSGDKIKSTEGVIRLTPDDGYEYYYGYYDKSPWDADNRYLIALKVRCSYKNVAPKENGTLVLVDTKNGNRVEEIATTSSWNVQQSCMAQWMGPDFKSRLIYNDFRDGKYCSVVYDVEARKELKVLPLPIYDISRDGKTALSLDFSRLHRMRPGYGYSNLPDDFAKELCPDRTCVWKIDVESGAVTELFKYTDFAGFEPDKTMDGASHKVNHLMISPNGKRFMVLHRWFQKGRKHTRLVTVNMDGSEMYNLSDDVFVSHCYWKNDDEILSFLRKKETGNHYYLMKDKTQEYKMLWPNLNTDGHCSYSPDGKYIITDTYPNRKRIASVYLCTETGGEQGSSRLLARVFSPFRYDNDCRCDLHPRWNRDGSKVCIDSVHEGKRGVYAIDIAPARHKLVFFSTRMRKSGPIAQTLDLVRNIDKSKYSVCMVTLYKEKEKDSLKKDFEKEGVECICMGMGRLQSILFGKRKVKSLFRRIRPSIIHSVGMPLYKIALAYKGCPNFTTIHNYVFEDYPVKYGPFVGNIMAKQDLRLIRKNVSHMVACSKSLSEIYKERHSIDVDFIRNGVDTNRYEVPTEAEKIEKRKALDIPVDRKVLVFTGQVCSRKNQAFVVDSFAKINRDDLFLVILGDGPELPRLRELYGDRKNILFKGHITNVADYLKASDLYVSSSTSEGLPIGALEALSAGLPLLLSDIPQHKEVVYIDKYVGMIFKNNDFDSFKEQLQKLLQEDLRAMGVQCNAMAKGVLSAERMTALYVGKYESLLA